MKQRDFRGKAGALFMAAMTVIICLQLGREARAADAPDVGQFADKEQLKEFNTNAQDDKRAAKVYFGSNGQEWWIVGEDSAGGGLVLFAAEPIGESEFDLSVDERPYQGDTVYPSHYGASKLYGDLGNLSANTAFFSTGEQSRMLETTVYTKDIRNNKVYSTTGKLYAAAGSIDVNMVDVYKYVTAGSNSAADLDGGLRIDCEYWPENSVFWLRSPWPLNTNIVNVLVGDAQSPDNYVRTQHIFGLGQCSIAPAFQLDLADVLFASTAPAAASEGQLILNDAMTLRYESNNLGSAQVSFDQSKVDLAGVKPDAYLVVQNSNGAWAKKVSGTSSVSANEIDSSLTSFEGCKVWLEATDSATRMTEAVMAAEESGYSIHVIENTGVTISSNNAKQRVKAGSAITDISVQADKGYYLPDDYKDGVILTNGLNIAQRGNMVMISGTPGSDMTITLPAAAVMPKADKPEVMIARTSTSITAKVTNEDPGYGAVEYNWDNSGWAENNGTLSNLLPNTKHTLSVRFKGKGIYQASDEMQMDIATLEDGNKAIAVPANLTIQYKKDLKLADVDLSSFNGWEWADGTAALSVGTNVYKAKFFTTNLENAYDFANVDGYHAGGHYVERDVEVSVKKAESNIRITTADMDKAYDGSAVEEPQYTRTGSNGAVTVTWQEKIGMMGAKAAWAELKSAPSNAGEYQVTVTLSEDNYYRSASDTKTFTISKAANSWEEPLSIKGWTYGSYDDAINVPTAKAKYGTVVFTYSYLENGIYTSNIPANAGTWYVKASVKAENYADLEEAVSFMIEKAIPEPEPITGLTIEKGQALKEADMLPSR